MKIKPIIEATFKPAGHPAYTGPDKRPSFGPNRYFIVRVPTQVWRHIPGRPNTFPTFKSFHLDTDDEIHWLNGGLFAVAEGNVAPIHMHDPASESEGESYMTTNSKISRGLKAALKARNIVEIPKDNAVIPQSYR